MTHVLNEAPITRNEGREYWHAGRWRSVEAEPYECPRESAQASAEPPLSADTRDTATQSPATEAVPDGPVADAYPVAGAAGPNCQSCKWWTTSERFSKHVGECHRRSPFIIDRVHAEWPNTNDDDFCGDHEVRK